MTYTNNYIHCGEHWTVDDCDSFHNDRCPTCNKEIEPFSSDKFSNDGDMEDTILHVTEEDLIQLWESVLS